MPDYISYNLATGKIIDKFYSVDPRVVEGRNDILELPRDEFNALTIFHKVDFGVVRLMTQAEKDIYEKEKAQKDIDTENIRIIELDNKILNNLDGITLTKIDTAINNINNLNDAKIFLKKLCRYFIKFISR